MNNTNTSTKKLPLFKGRLDAVQIVDGINAAIKNANRLIYSANILFANGDYPSAVSFAILAIEESGKCSILREIALARNEDELEQGWRRYRSHTAKNATWNMIDYVMKGARKLEDFRAMFHRENMAPYLLDQIKQIGFYTDCLSKAHWSIPANVIDRSDANRILEIAKSHCRIKEISIKEIELWIECMAPVWMKSMDEMKNGILTWRKKMRDAGLVGDSDRFDEFITTGIDTGIKNE